MLGDVPLLVWILYIFCGLVDLQAPSINWEEAQKGRFGPGGYLGVTSIPLPAKEPTATEAPQADRAQALAERRRLEDLVQVRITAIPAADTDLHVVPYSPGTRAMGRSRENAILCIAVLLLKIQIIACRILVLGELGGAVCSISQGWWFGCRHLILQ